MTDINDPPWVVEIDGVKFATPEAVVILLQSVSEERDELREAGRRVAEELRHHVNEQNPEDSLGWCLKQLVEALDA